MIELDIPELTEEEKKRREFRKLVASREWQYYFKKGMKCHINEKMLDEYDYHHYKKYIGMEGEVIDCWTDLHAFAHGCAYSVRVKFGDDEVDIIQAGILDGGIKY
jgi:hypothetical protein